MAKILPAAILGQPSDSAGDSRNHKTPSHREDVPTQKWDVATSHNGTCGQMLVSFLGFSKTAAPWWNISMLSAEEADTCDVMTREDMCVGGCMDQIDVRDRQKIAKRKRDQLSQGTGQRVEVFVAQQREWYVGRVAFNEENTDMPLLSIKFGNGAILRNVRPEELRSVPRTTVVGWLYTLLWVVLGLFCFAVPFYTIMYNMYVVDEHQKMSVSQAGLSWMFPDVEPVQLGDGTNTSLYNLTWGQLAAADASPETWLNTWVQQPTDKSEDIRTWTITDVRAPLFQRVERKLEYAIAMTLPPINALLVASVYFQLRRFPTYLQITLLVMLTLTWALYDAAQESKQRSTKLYDIYEHFFSDVVFWLTSSIIFIFILIPPMAALARARKRIHGVMRFWRTVCLLTIGYTFVMIARVLNAGFVLERMARATTDSESLERVAGALTYLLSANLYCDYQIVLWIPTGLMFGYATLGDRWDAWFILLCAAALVPSFALVYFVLEPLDFVDPVNYRFALSARSKQIPFQRNLVYLGSDRGTLMETISMGIMIAALIRPVINIMFIKLRVATNVGTLAKRVRQSLLRMSTPGWHVDPAMYKALKDRRLSKSTVRPISRTFERQLAQPGARLQNPLPFLCCLGPFFSAKHQLMQVLSSTGLVLAGYMAQVVNAVKNPARRNAMYTILETVLDKIGCGQEHRNCVLELVGTPSHSDSPDKPSSNVSSLGQLRGVIRKLGTKHRDSIYLLRMESVGREPGFREFVALVDRVQAEVSHFLGSQQLRQLVVPQSDTMSWSEKVAILIDSASGVRNRYNAFMAVVAEKCGAVFHPAPLKGMFRISEKLWLRSLHETEFPQGDCANVFDMVRGMLVCPSTGVLNVCTTMLASCDEMLDRALSEDDDDTDIPAAQAAGITTSIHVLRAKNRFARPTSGGWADVLLNFSFESDPDHHVCEVQLVHEGMLTARKHCNAHAAYSKFRSALEMLETFGLMDPVTLVKEGGVSDQDQNKFLEDMDRDYKQGLIAYRHTTGLSPLLSTTVTSDTDSNVRDNEDLDAEVRLQKMEMELNKQKDEIMQLKLIIAELVNVESL